MLVQTQRGGSGGVRRGAVAPRATQEPGRSRGQARAKPEPSRSQAGVNSATVARPALFHANTSSIRGVSAQFETRSSPIDGLVLSNVSANSPGFALHARVLNSRAGVKLRIRSARGRVQSSSLSVFETGFCASVARRTVQDVVCYVNWLKIGPAKGPPLGRPAAVPVGCAAVCEPARDCAAVGAGAEQGQVGNNEARAV